MAKKRPDKSTVESESTASSCAACGKALRPNSSFCASCGASVSLRREQGPPWYKLLLAAIVALHSAFLFSYLNKPFTGANTDDNGLYGLAAYNLSRFGFFKLKFGMVGNYFESFSEIGTNFYTHHPQLFVIPTAILYRFFGVSEATTRLAGIVLSILSLAAFCWAVYLYYDDIRLAVLAGAVYAFFPGVIYYSTSISEKIAVLVFTNFTILSFVLLRKYRTKRLLYLVLGLVFVGGFQGWHYYFVPVALWFFVAQHRETFSRKALLIALPLVSLLAFLSNFLHFYILKGMAFTEIFDVFFLRASRMPLDVFAGKYADILSWSFTWPAVIVGLAFIAYRVYESARDKDVDLLLVFAVQPVLVILVFQQWSLHAFGAIYWAPALALAVGTVLSRAIDSKQAVLLAGAAVIAIAFLYSVPAGMNVMNEKLALIGPRDVALLRRISTEAPRGDTIALGPDQTGLMYSQLFEWYAHRDLRKHHWENKEADFVIAFRDPTDQSYQDNLQRLRGLGYETVASGDLLLLMKRK